jgi:hypothetical protein
MNVEIGAEAALFPEKEYINGIAVAVQCTTSSYCLSCVGPDALRLPVRPVYSNCCGMLEAVYYGSVVWSSERLLKLNN